MTIPANKPAPRKPRKLAPIEQHIADRTAAALDDPNPLPVQARKHRLPPAARHRETPGSLTARERVFVDLLADGIERRDAFRQAFKVSNPNALRAGMSKVMARPQVQSAIIQAAKREIAAGAIGAGRKINRLVDHAASEYVALDAAKTVLDRIGVAHQPAREDRPPITVNISVGMARTAKSAPQTEHSVTIDVQPADDGGDNGPSDGAA